MLKLHRRRRKRPALTDWDTAPRTPVKALPVGFPYVTCRPLCPGCSPCNGYFCNPVVSGNCKPGTIFYPTTCLPSTTCPPTVPPGCVPRPCFPV
jgi:hypothetical protein